MRKLLLFFLVANSLPIFSQTLTYTCEAEYWRFDANQCSSASTLPLNTCLTNSYRWVLKNGSNNAIVENLTNPVNNKLTKTYTIPLYSTYELQMSASCDCRSMTPPVVPSVPCNQFATQTILPNGINYKGNITTNFGVENAIKGGYAIGPNSGICIGTVILKNFKPNGIVISKPGYDLYPNGVLTPPEYIAGEQIDLIATPGILPNKYPDIAYHWQYSIDNMQTWIDVPVITGKTATDTPTPAFTIEDILGADHVNHFGYIDFRIGYTTRPFTETYRIKYSPGAPVIKKILYEGPKCASDNIQSLTVFFDRNLYVNEDIYPLYVQKISNTTPILSQAVASSLTYDPLTEFYKYSFTNLGKLDNGEEYKINYQARISEVPRGTLTSSNKTFLYQDPEPLTFTVDPTDPLCHNEEGGLTINVKGGSGKYFYSLDEGINIPFSVTTVETSSTTNNITTISRSASQPINLPITDAKKSYKIKVMDEHGCIEKSL